MTNEEIAKLVGRGRVEFIEVGIFIYKMILLIVLILAVRTSKLFHYIN